MTIVFDIRLQNILRKFSNKISSVVISTRSLHLFIYLIQEMAKNKEILSKEFNHFRVVEDSRQVLGNQAFSTSLERTKHRVAV